MSKKLRPFQVFYWWFLGVAVTVAIAGIAVAVVYDRYEVGIIGIALLFCSAMLGQSYHEERLP